MICSNLDDTELYVLNIKTGNPTTLYASEYVFSPSIFNNRVVWEASTDETNSTRVYSCELKPEWGTFEEEEVIEEEETEE